MVLFSGKASEMIHVLLNALYENKKSEGRSLRCDRHKTDMRNGVFCRAAGLAYDPSS